MQITRVSKIKLAYLRRKYIQILSTIKYFASDVKKYQNKNYF